MNVTYQQLIVDSKIERNNLKGKLENFLEKFFRNMISKFCLHFVKRIFLVLGNRFFPLPHPSTNKFLVLQLS